MLQCVSKSSCKAICNLYGCHPTVLVNRPALHVQPDNLNSI